MLLIEDGKLGLDQPLAEILPKFADMRVQRVPDGSLRDLVPAARPISMGRPSNPLLFTCLGPVIRRDEEGERVADDSGPQAIAEAFHIASTGRPGPVLVDIPQDLSRADITYEPVTDVRLPGGAPLATLWINSKRIGPGLFIQHGYCTSISADEIDSQLTSLVG